LRWLSMFSGVGGFEIGLERAARLAGTVHETVAACDHDPYAVSVYSRRFPRVKMFHCDAERLDVGALPEFDAVCGGFPCRTFSTAGRRLGIEGDGGACFFEIVRIARERRPRILFLENVPGLLSHDGGRTFAKMLAALDGIRFDAVWQCINCSTWVPQDRTRLFLVCCARESGIDPASVLPLMEVGAVMPGPQQKARGARKRVHRQDISVPGVVGTIDAHYRKGGGSRTMILVPASAVPSMPPRAAVLAVQDVWPGRKKAQGGPILRDGDMFTLCAGKRRLGVMYPERAGASGAGAGGKGAGGKGMLRLLTPVECERLQGLPDDHTRWGADGLELSDTRRINLVGRAVPPPAVCAIALRLPADGA